MLNTKLFDETDAPPPGFDMGKDTSAVSWKSLLFRSALTLLGIGQGSLHPGAPLQETLGICAFFQIALIGSMGLTWGVHCLYLLSSRLVHKYRRPSYYNAEAERRAAKIKKQRSKSHKIRRRRSILLPPSKQELLEAWKKASCRGALEDKLRLGSMMVTIEAVVDNRLIRDETGAIVGRKGGVKEWLFRHCNPLAAHYSALMHYKSLADKTQLVCGLEDPEPMAVVLGMDETTITVGPKIDPHTLPGAGQSSPHTSLPLGFTTELRLPDVCIRLTGVKITVGPEWLAMFAKRIGKARENYRELHREAGGKEEVNGGKVDAGGGMKDAGGGKVDVRGGKEKRDGGEERMAMGRLERRLYQRLGIVRERRLRAAAPSGV